MIERYSRQEFRDLWSDDNKFAVWLEVETAAMEAMVHFGIVPQSALESLRSKAKFDSKRILEIEQEVKHDVIAFLTNLAENIGEDSRYVHLGMTSSDLVDTSFCILLSRATDIIIQKSEQFLESLKELALRHKNTICMGRTHGIHAEPTTFGLKVLLWYSEFKRALESVKDAKKVISVGAISGPVGTFSMLSPKIEKYVCEKFGLTPDPITTQVISRDRHARLFLSFALLSGVIEHIALEIRHLQRTEVREAEEFFSKGQKGSSAMPHKRNPILSENLCGLSRYVRSLSTSSLENIALWHERDISHSSIERNLGQDITTTIDFMIHRATGLISNLVVYPKNMERNIDLLGGLTYSSGLLVSLSEKGMKREDAYKLVQLHALACYDEINEFGSAKISFKDRVYNDSGVSSLLSDQDLKDIFSPKRYLAHVEEIFSRVI